MAKGYKYFLLAGLSGLLLALAYPGWGFDLGWLVWFGLVPLFWTLTQTSYEHVRAHKRFGFLVGFAAGLIYFLIIFRWFWATFPLDTLGIENRCISFIAVLLVYLISSAGMALFWGVFGLAISKLRSGRISTTGYQLLIAPALFVLLEYASSWGFGFLWAGSGSLFGPHWTLGNLAYALADNHLTLKLTSFVGIYGVVFAIVFVNYLVFIILKNKLSWPLIIRAVLIILITIAITFGPKLIKSAATQQKGGKQINFAIIQTAQPTKLFLNPKEALAGLEEQLKLLDRIAKKHPESQLIVFPEASELFKNISLFMTSAQVQRYFSELFKEPKLIIAGGRVLETDGQTYSRVFDLDTKNGIENYYDKRLLAPGGEFLPYPIKLIAWLFSKTTATQYDSLRELSVGAKDVSTVNFRDQFKASPMICSELLSPGLTKQASQNSDVIISMASYGIFHGNQTIAKQMLATTRFRASETAKPVITSANLGQSYVIDGSGNIAYLATDSAPQILTGSIVLGSGETWYNKLGDLPIILVSFLFVISSFLLIWFRDSRRP